MLDGRSRRSPRLLYEIVNFEVVVQADLRSPSELESAGFGPTAAEPRDERSARKCEAVAVRAAGGQRLLKCGLVDVVDLEKPGIDGARVSSVVCLVQEELCVLRVHEERANREPAREPVRKHFEVDALDL